jgi:hypothetical protein
MGGGGGGVSCVIHHQQCHCQGAFYRRVAGIIMVGALHDEGLFSDIKGSPFLPNAAGLRCVPDCETRGNLGKDD